MSPEEFEDTDKNTHGIFKLQSKQVKFERNYPTAVHQLTICWIIVFFSTNNTFSDTDQTLIIEHGFESDYNSCANNFT